MTLEENPTRTTWRDLLHFIRDEGLIDEYFTFRDVPLDEPIWNDERKAIAVFWVVGGSEGYYVHVQPIQSDGDWYYAKLENPSPLGKFWSIELAEEAVRKIQRWIN